MGWRIWRHDISTGFQVCSDYTSWLPRTLKDILPRLFPYCPKPVISQKTKDHIKRIILHGQDVKKGVESKCSWPPGHCQCNNNAWFTTPEETSHVSTIIGTGIVFVNWRANTSLGKWPSLFFYASVRKHSWSTFMHVFRYNASIIKISTMLITIKSHSDRLSVGYLHYCSLN